MIPSRFDRPPSGPYPAPYYDPAFLRNLRKVSGLLNWCPKCGIGIDDDGDGDCGLCHDMKPFIAAEIHVAVLGLRQQVKDAKLEVEKLHSVKEALEVIKRYLNG